MLENVISFGSRGATGSLGTQDSISLLLVDLSPLSKVYYISRNFVEIGSFPWPFILVALALQRLATSIDYAFPQVALYWSHGQIGLLV